MRSPRVPSTVLAVPGRVALFALLWLILTEGDLSGLPLAVLAVLAAAGISLRLVPAETVSLRPIGVASLIAFFILESIRGGIDVARRALDPRLPIDPGFVDYHVRLPEGAGRVLLVSSVSLLPGTLSVRLSGDVLRIHLIFRVPGAEQGIRRLEEHVADALGAPLGPGPDGA